MDTFNIASTCDTKEQAVLFHNREGFFICPLDCWVWKTQGPAHSVCNYYPLEEEANSCQKIPEVAMSNNVNETSWVSPPVDELRYGVEGRIRKHFPWLNSFRYLAEGQEVERLRALVAWVIPRVGMMREAERESWFISVIIGFKALIYFRRTTSWQLCGSTNRWLSN